MYTEEILIIDSIWPTIITTIFVIIVIVFVLLFVLARKPLPLGNGMNC